MGSFASRNLHVVHDMLGIKYEHNRLELCKRDIKQKLFKFNRGVPLQNLHGFDKRD